jgi:hypothetical protein
MSCFPSSQECEKIRDERYTFDVKNEICSQVLGAHSSKVELIEFSVQDFYLIIKCFQSKEHNTG